MNKYVLIAIGGIFGSIARYWVSTNIASFIEERFPLNTLVVNLSACVLMGFAAALLNHRPGWNEGWRFLLLVGFIGTYSTFSTFEWEIFTRIEGGAGLIAILYAVVSVLVGLLAVWCGAQLSKAFV